MFNYILFFRRDPGNIMISFSYSFNDMPFENNKIYSEKFKVLDQSGIRWDGMNKVEQHELSNYDYFIESYLINKHTHKLSSQ